MARLSATVVIGLLLSSALCACSPPSASPTPSLSGGIPVTFDVEGETCRTFITSEEAMEQVFTLERRESRPPYPAAGW